MPLPFIRKLYNGQPSNLHNISIIHHVQRLSWGRKKKSNSLDCLPDELIICILRYLPPQDLALNVARTCKRFAMLWCSAICHFEIKGKLRKMNEDQVIGVLRKFVRLESLDICNNGSSEDFQITDKGLLQLAHKSIYIDADFREQNDPLSGEYNFNFNYEAHLDSLDTLTTDTDVDSCITDDDDSSVGGSHYESNTPNGSKNPPYVPQWVVSTQSLVGKGYYYSKPSPQFRRTFAEPNFGLLTLHTLNLTGCHGLTDKGVKLLLYICKNLKNLNLRGCNKVNDTALSYICQFEKLETLNLTGCTHITDVGLSYLASTKAENLTTVDLTFCHQITDKGLKDISKITTITNLDLTCCRKITAAGLVHLFENCTKLVSLNLTGCDQITLCNIINRGLPFLERLGLMGCKLTCDKCMKDLVNVSKKLKKLNLAYSDHVSDKGIEYIASACKELRVLNLKRCNNITDKALTALSEHLGNSLLSLNLTGCRNFTNRALGSLPALRRMRSLNISRCAQITDEGLTYLCLCVSLESLDLSEIPQITQQGLQNLVESLCDDPDNLLTARATVPNQPQGKQAPRRGLKELSVAKCNKISKEFIDTIYNLYSISPPKVL